MITPTVLHEVKALELLPGMIVSDSLRLATVRTIAQALAEAEARGNGMGFTAGEIAEHDRIVELIEGRQEALERRGNEQGAELLGEILGEL